MPTRCDIERYDIAREGKMSLMWVQNELRNPFPRMRDIREHLRSAFSTMDYLEHELLPTPVIAELRKYEHRKEHGDAQ